MFYFSKILAKNRLLTRNLPIEGPDVVSFLDRVDASRDGHGQQELLSVALFVVESLPQFLYNTLESIEQFCRDYRKWVVCFFFLP